MEKITFHHVIPHVFATNNDLQSAVWGQELCLEKGHTYLVQADSGTGKSTFCSYILGYRHDYDGKLLFDDRDARQLSVGDWARLRRQVVSCLYQELCLFPELTTLENIEIKNQLTHHTNRRQIIEWLGCLGLADKVEAKIGHMSYGQQQRVAMVRALVQPFDFILLDEPISHLDDGNAAIMAEILTEEARRQQAAIVVTSIGKHMALPYETVVRL